MVSRKGYHLSIVGPDIEMRKREFAFESIRIKNCAVLLDSIGIPVRAHSQV